MSLAEENKKRAQVLQFFNTNEMVQNFKIAISAYLHVCVRFTMFPVFLAISNTNIMNCGDI